MGQDVVRPCLVLNQVLDAQIVQRSPAHVGNQPGTGVTLLLRIFQPLVEKVEHRVLVEVARAEVSLVPRPELELALPNERGHGDVKVLIMVDVVLPFGRIDDVQRLFAAFEALPHEGIEDAVHLLATFDDGADVSVSIQGASGEPDGFVSLMFHVHFSVPRSG
ncbi:MAG: hypothetical protein QOJ59_1430 [Thermomicrobiales bacterium]|nr:hypothetical protein [Thermomicrobiales bacterium]